MVFRVRRTIRLVGAKAGLIEKALGLIPPKRNNKGKVSPTRKGSVEYALDMGGWDLGERFGGLLDKHRERKKEGGK